MTRSPQGGVGRSHPSFWIVVLVGLAAALASALLVGGARSASQPQGLIAFTRGSIYVMNADGSDVRLLWRGFARELAWSPDGQRLAFVADRRIWVMGADGSRPARLTSRVRGDFYGLTSPSWSPDGRRIAYSYAPKDDVNRDVWVMNADGSNKRRLARTPDCSEVDVDWSPKGDRLVTTCEWGWGTRDLRLMKADGSAVSRLLGHKGGVPASEPDWSPDGRRIAFARSERGDWRMGIYLINAAGGSPVRLSPHGVNASDREPTWSPDGRRIAFAHVSMRLEGDVMYYEQPAGIYVMNADGTSVTTLTLIQGDQSPAWQPRAAP